MFNNSNYNYKSSYRCQPCQLDWPPIFECDTCPKCHGDTEEKSWMPMGEATYKAKLAQIAKAEADEEEARVAAYRAKEADFEQFYAKREEPAIQASLAAFDEEWANADWITSPPDHQRPAPPLPQPPAPGTPQWPYFDDGRGTS